MVIWLRNAVIEQISSEHVNDPEVITELSQSSLDVDHNLLCTTSWILSDKNKQCCVSVDVFACYSTVPYIPLFNHTMKSIDIIYMVNLCILRMIFQHCLTTVLFFEKSVISRLTIQPCHTVLTDKRSKLHDIRWWWCSSVSSLQICIATSLDNCWKADLFTG